MTEVEREVQSLKSSVLGLKPKSHDKITENQGN